MRGVPVIGLGHPTQAHIGLSRAGTAIATTADTGVTVNVK